MINTNDPKQPLEIPLHDTTWDLDRKEGSYVNELKATHTEPLSEPLLEVPDDLGRNVAVTSVDALVNWVVNLPFGHCLLALHAALLK